MNPKQTAAAAERRQRIAEMIARPGGASTADIRELVGCAACIACEHVRVLRAEGRAHTGVVFIGRSGGKTTRHFGTAAERDEWSARAPSEIAARRPGGVRRDLLPLLQRPEGCTAREARPIIGCASVDDACSRMLKLQKRGEVYGVDIKGQARRYFATPADAAEYRRTAAPVSPEPVQSLAVLPRKEKPAKATGTPVVHISKRVVGALAPGQYITTEKTRHIIDATPRPTAAWQTLQLAPDPRWPSFASARPGMDPLTGRVWGAQA